MGSTSEFDFDNIQGDIWPGLSKRYQQFFFFSIEDPAAFKAVLKTLADEVITSAHDAMRDRAHIHKVKATESKAPESNFAESIGAGIVGLAALPLTVPLNFFSNLLEPHEIPRSKGSNDVRITGVNMSFTAKGMTKLSKEKFEDDPFLKGMYKDMVAEGRDQDGDWMPEFKNGSIDGVVLICGTEYEVKEKTRELARKYFCRSHGVRPILTLDGNERPGNQRGHEHFGYLDGISQPLIRGLDDNAANERGARKNLTNPGVILFGYDGEVRQGVPSAQPTWAKDGSFLVFRKIRQFVPEWNRFLKDEATRLHFTPEQFGARLMGRWKSGAPVQLNPVRDDPDMATWNDFDYPENDHTNCPFASHMRKTKPRSGMQNFDVFDIMRRGIPYGPELDWTETEKTWRDRGLMFLCYQTSLTLGFQFIRKKWIDVDDFPEKKAEFTGGRLAGQDAVVGQSVKSDIKGHHKNSQLAIVDGQGQHNQVTFTPFIQSNGGEYFFTPSLKLLRDLAVAPAV